MDVLLTGGTGFVGRHVAAALAARGHHARCLVRGLARGAHLEALGHSLVDGGLEDEQAVRRACDGADAVLHVAGLVRARGFEELRSVNADAAARLARTTAVLARPGARFLLVSSQAAGGPSCPGRRTTEDDAPRPVSWYGLSKLMGERAVQRCLPRERVTVVRPPSVYGPHDSDIFEFFKSAAQGLRLRLGTRSRPISIVHAVDLAEGIVRALEEPVAAGRTYYLANRSSASMHDLLARISVATGRAGVPLLVPEPVVLAAAVVADEWARFRGAVPKLCRDKAREFLAPGWDCDAARARAELDWDAKIGLDEGLAATAQWYRTEGWL